MTDRLIAQVILSGRPTTWKRVKANVSGIMYVPADVRAFQRRVRDNVMADMVRRGTRPAQSGVPVALEIEASYTWAKTEKAKVKLIENWWAAKVTSDWDNIGKIISDALQESDALGATIAYTDDRQICRGVVTKRRCESKSDERVEITVLDLSGESLI